MAHCREEFALGAIRGLRVQLGMTELLLGLAPIRDVSHYPLKILHFPALVGDRPGFL